jgi:hypothetical protein
MFPRFSTVLCVQFVEGLKTANTSNGSLSVRPQDCGKVLFRRVDTEDLCRRVHSFVSFMSPCPDVRNDMTERRILFCSALSRAVAYQRATQLVGCHSIIDGFACDMSETAA